MGDRNFTANGGAAKRLGIANDGGPSSGVARMANCNVAAVQPVERVLIKDLGDEPHVFVDPNLLAIPNGDPCALLPTMLKSKQPEERDPSNILTPPIYAKNPALFLGGF